MAKTKNLTVKIPTEDHDELFVIAKCTGIEVSSQIRNIVKKFIAEYHAGIK
jgi:hypothetical protein